MEKHLDILQDIVSSRKKPWPPADKHCKIIDFNKCSEQEIFLEVCSNVLCPISTTVTVEHNYTHAVHALLDTKLLCGHKGIGDATV